MLKNVILCILGVLLTVGCVPPDDKRENGVLSVRAEAEVRVQPNRAALSLAVIHRVKDLQAGREYMQKTLQNLENFLKQQGTQAKNFQIQQIRITPLYRTGGVSETKTLQTDEPQYEFEQSFTVTLEDVSAYEGLLYGLLQRGVNRVTDVEFYSSEIRKYRDQARLNALKAAQEKAAQLARAAGVETGRILSLEETSSPAYFLSASNAVQNAFFPETETELGTGLISLKAAVSVSYEIK